jgi:hypothetical protein
VALSIVGEGVLLGLSQGVPLVQVAQRPGADAEHHRRLGARLDGDIADDEVHAGAGRTAFIQDSELQPIGVRSGTAVSLDGLPHFGPLQS